MSIMQRLTLIGMYNYNPSLFDNLSLPAGYDKNTFIETLLLEHGEKCVLYTDLEFMKYTIGVLSRKWKLELERIYEALTAKYNPIYNYDRYEESTDGRGKNWKEKTDANYSNNRTVGLTDTRTPGLTETTTRGTTDETKQTKAGYTEQKTDGHTKQVADGYTNQTIDGYNQQDGNQKGSTEELVAAFNSSTYENSKKTITDVGKVYNSTGKIENSMGQVDTSQGKIETDAGTMQTEHKGTDTLTTTGTDTTAHTGTDNLNTAGTLADKNGNETENSTHNAHLYGNIGVTTSASMVREVVRDRLEVNLYSTAAQIFANEMLLQIY